MKNIYVLTIIMLLASCKTTAPLPYATRTITSEVMSIQTDNQSLFQTPFYILDSNRKLPVRVQFRAFYEDKERQFIQLFVISTSEKNHEFKSANGEDGISLTIVPMDLDMDSYRNERFGIRIPFESLKKMSQKDWTIKISGSLSEEKIIIPSRLSTAIFNKLKCFESNECE